MINCSSVHNKNVSTSLVCMWTWRLACGRRYLWLCTSQRLALQWVSQRHCRWSASVYRTCVLEQFLAKIAMTS